MTYSSGFFAISSGFLAVRCDPWRSLHPFLARVPCAGGPLGLPYTHAAPPADPGVDLERQGMSSWTIELTGDGSNTLRSARFDQTCHSCAGAREETRHVSLELSGVAERLRSGLATRVLEVGFGTGLGLLLTADLACSTGTELDFVSLERDLIGAELLRGLRAQESLRDAELVARLAAALEAGVPSRDLALALAPRVRAEVLVGDARDRVLELAPASFDACYLDPFSPDVNPELWTEEFLGHIRAALRPGARLSSYCVRGEVRRRLQALGFRVEKRPGIGRKREVLVAWKRGGELA
jgi:tRNA U34 5-methylaminomethyl-2-thiouridine-forming methyltransferase MnmC